MRIIMAFSFGKRVEGSRIGTPRGTSGRRLYDGM